MGAEPLRAPARLVIRTPNWLGDIVMALPAMAAVRRAFPDAAITVAAPAGLAPLFDEETAVAPQDVLALAPSGGERASLAAGGFDAILILPHSFRSAWVARGAGIAQRWGYAAGMRGSLLTRAARRPRGRMHQAEYYVELVRQLAGGEVRLKPDATGRVRLKPDTTTTAADSVGSGFSRTSPDARIRVGAGTAARAGTLLLREGIAEGTPIVGFAPGAAYGHAKRWPPRRVAGVIARLASAHGVTSVLVGAEGDRGAGWEVESALPATVRIVNLIGRTDLRALAGVLSRAHAFVSNDSGAMHLAAALGVPVTAIFGPTDERATSPGGDADVLVNPVFCRPCMLRDCPIDHRCMKGVTEEAVFTSVSARLTAPREVHG